MLKAAAHMMLVTPTGDNSEREHGRLILAGQSQRTMIYRGVVLHVGTHCCDSQLDAGNVVHYTAFTEMGDHHLVGEQHVLAFEDDTTSYE